MSEECTLINWFTEELPTLDWGSTGNEIFLRSVVSNPTFTFNWSIEDYSKLLQGNPIVSFKFCPTRSHEFVAYLKNCSTALRIVIVQNKGSTIRVTHKCSITDIAGTVFTDQSTCHLYRPSRRHIRIADASSFELKMFLSRYKSEIFIIKCVMELEEIFTESLPCKIRGKPGSSSDHLPALSEDLKAVYNASLYADVNLKVGDTIVPAHKLILCARSSVFARLFEVPMAETEENVLNITDVDPPVLKDLVAFLYTGELAKDDFESVYALYYAADKYAVSSLRKACSSVLLSKLEVENACRVLVLADQHSDVEFKDSVLNFVRFYIGKIWKTSAFNDLATPLKKEVTAFLSK